MDTSCTSAWLKVVLFSLAYIFSTTNADFYWSSAGPVANKVCVQWLETAEPTEHTWHDNYLCSDKDYGMKWSSAGAISGMECTQILETADPDTWADNYLCVPYGSPLQWRWSSSGAIGGLTCIQILETAEPTEHTWHDNYLCYDKCDLLPCNDGDACNGEETCANGQCVAGTPIECNDGDACNGEETCANGQCVAGTLIECDDGNACNGLEECADGTCITTPGSSIDCGFAFECDPILGKCVRDCDSFDIDGYLECSSTFDFVENEVNNLITRIDGVDTRINGVDTRIDDVDTRIGGVDTRIDGVDSQINAVNTEIADLNDKIARFGALYGVNDPNYAAQAGASNLIGSDGSQLAVNSFSYKTYQYIFIIGLLLLNLLGMSWMYCCKGRKSNQYSKVEVFSDSEAQQLNN